MADKKTRGMILKLKYQEGASVKRYRKYGFVQRQNEGFESEVKNYRGL
jgi:hypothetical protein